MKCSYTLQYVQADLLHRSNLPFTLINLLGILISTFVLVLLLSGFFAFQKNGEKLMDKLGLSIEVTNREEIVIVSEAQSKQKDGTDSNKHVVISQETYTKLQNLQGVHSVHLWTPTVFLFYTNQGRLYDGAEGRTIDLNDPLFEIMRDIRSPNPNVGFLPRDKQNSSVLHDEIGIIIPFILLKKLDYMPAQAEWNKPETWVIPKTEIKCEIPDTLRVRIKGKEESIAIDVEVPIIGVVSEIEGGRYLVSKDFYRIFGSNWQNHFRGLIRDRQGKLIFKKGEYPNTPQLQKELQQLPMPEETHATVYAQNRSAILPLIRDIRNMNLRADCAVEHHLSDYQQQESFFLFAAGGVALVMFFFSGVILFATFHALVLRKLQEIGILKACGASQKLAFTFFALQAIIISSVAGIFGILSGMLVAKKVTSLIQEYAKLDPNMELFYLPLEYMAGILLFSIAFCLFVIFFPVRSAVKIDADLLIRG